MILEGDKIIIGEQNYKINKEFENYLKLYPEYKKKYFTKLDKFDNIKLYRGLSSQLFIFLGFIFDRKIELGDLESIFSIEEINIISSILDEIINLSKGMGSLFYEGNILSAFILSRGLLERVLIFLIIFEEKDNLEIKKRLQLYKLHSMVIAYEKADELGAKEEKEKIIKELGEEKIKELVDLFKVGKQYRFEKGVYGKKIGAGDLIEKLVPGFNKSFYQTLSLSVHGVYHNINLLGNNTFAPNLNDDLYKGILYLQVILIREVISKLISYYFNEKLELIEYFDSLLFNLANYNERK